MRDHVAHHGGQSPDGAGGDRGGSPTRKTPRICPCRNWWRQAPRRHRGVIPSVSPILPREPMSLNPESEQIHGYATNDLDYPS